MLALRSLFYVSHSLLPTPAAEIEVAKMVGLARQRNLATGIKGALVFTGFYFAQCLEGAPLAVEELMMNICNDKRHTNIDIILDSPEQMPQFDEWDMAFAGPSSFVGNRVSALAEIASASSRSIRQADAQIVVRLMQEFAIAA